MRAAKSGPYRQAKRPMRAGSGSGGGGYIVGSFRVGAPGLVGASEGDATPGFSGSAAATGIRITMKSSNIPFTDTPIDAGGPTAQVVADSGGTSQGYAAVPDPGPIVIGGPGLAAGVLAGGVPGVVPPTKLPQEPPGYPFYVHSDAGAAPEQKLGSGPFELDATSTPGASKSSARTGLQAGDSTHAGSYAAPTRSFSRWEPTRSPNGPAESWWPPVRRSAGGTSTRPTV